MRYFWKMVFAASLAMLLHLSPCADADDAFSRLLQTKNKTRVTQSPTTMPTESPTRVAVRPTRSPTTASENSTQAPSASPTTNVTSRSPPSNGTGFDNSTGAPTAEENVTASPTERENSTAPENATYAPTVNADNKTAPAPSTPPIKNVTGTPTHSPTASPSKTPTRAPTPSPTPATVSPTSMPTHSETQRLFYMKLFVEGIKTRLLTGDIDPFQKNFIVASQGTASNILVQVRVSGLERVVKPGFIADDFFPSWNWHTNIVDGVQIEGNADLFFHHYQDTDAFVRSCWTSTLECSDDVSRKLYCDAVFTSGRVPKCDPFFKTQKTCETSFGGSTWNKCAGDVNECLQIQDAMDTASLCGISAKLPLGWARIDMPKDAATWSRGMYGARNEWSELHTAEIVNGGSVAYRVSFWAQRCAIGEYITPEGFCAPCPDGHLCRDGVSASPCGRGSYVNVSTSTCSVCKSCGNDEFLRGCSGSNPGTCAPCRYAPGIRDCAATEALVACVAATTPILEDVSSCTLCATCKTGFFAKGCEGHAKGVCTPCPPCEGGKLRSQCSGKSSGVCVAAPSFMEKAADSLGFSEDTFILLSAAIIAVVAAGLFIFARKKYRKRAKWLEMENKTLEQRLDDLDEQIEAAHDAHMNQLNQERGRLKSEKNLATAKSNNALRKSVKILEDLKQENGKLRQELLRFKRDVFRKKGTTTSPQDAENNYKSMRKGRRKKKKAFGQTKLSATEDETEENVVTIVDPEDLSLDINAFDEDL